MQQLIIDRSKWRTGRVYLDNGSLKKYGSTLLLNRQGYMCCLGFYCEQLVGIPKNGLLGVPSPEELNIDDIHNIELLVTKIDDYEDGYTLVPTGFTTDAIEINDSISLSSKDREDQIVNHFKKIDVEVIFEKEYK